ncbi:uncharacterized protein LOC135376477 isoform X2 [Ornithodoros turicata]|uniref:uncharacterized protein LOC135376477 isoform X2 n=1 Tax=Ornithodoros turicata TaxID=34597 RepID=UPI003138C38E
MVICFAACLLLFFGALATILSSKKAGDADDDSTETDRYYFPVPGGASVQSTLPSADDVTPRVPTTKVTRKPLSQRPLLCSYKRDMKPDYPYPPDGLCDFLFHTFGVLPEGFNYNEYEEITDDDKALLAKFKEEAMKSKTTEFGIDMYDHFENATIITLSTDEGKAAVKALWGYKIVHYAVLDYIVYARGDHFVMKISMLAKLLLDLRDEFRSLHEAANSFFFLGIGSISEDTYDDQAGILKYAMSHILPDAVLYRTARTDCIAYHDCTFSPPALWDPGNTTTQMSFDGAFRMRSWSTWPSSVVQMISFSPAIAYMEDEEHFKFNKRCDTYYLKPASFKCSEENKAANGSVITTAPNGMDVYRLTVEDEDSTPLYSFAGYDTPESMKRKLRPQYSKP